MSTIITHANTPLQMHVAEWLDDRGTDYDDGWRGAYADLQYGGCASGMVGELIYHSDTQDFYQRHQREIDALLSDMISETGCQPAELFREWDESDPLARESSNITILAWFAFEETAYRLANAAGVE